MITIGQGWRIFSNPFQPEVHVVPVDDYRPHDFTLTCWCGARPDEDRVVTHNSLDRREMFEGLPVQ